MGVGPRRCQALVDWGRGMGVGQAGCQKNLLPIPSCDPEFEVGYVPGQSRALASIPGSL